MTRSTVGVATIAAAMLTLALVAALVSGSSAAAPAATKAKTDCGTYKSTSIYDKGRVFAIRGVKCKKARKVAKTYDHKGRTPGPWRCGLAHGGGRALFSCGYGESSGDIRDWPHALVAKGVKRPSADPPDPGPPDPSPY